jgi:hypothetical protein
MEEDVFDTMEMENEKDLKPMEQRMEDGVHPYKMDSLRVVALLNSCLI